MQFNEQMLLFISVEDDIQKLSFANVFHNGAFKNFAILSGKHLCWNNCTKKGLQLRFLLRILQNLKNSFSTEYLLWLFLDI